MANETYSANTDIETFEYPANIQKRPSMYLGERGSQMSVGAREIIDNSTHESIRGYATRMKVEFNSDTSITITDNGRGLPTDINEKTGKNGIILTMATLHSGGNFSTKTEAGKSGAGLNGVGASATNALSKRFDVFVYRDNKEYRLSFKNGHPGHFDGEEPDSPFTPGSEILINNDNRSPEEKKNYKTGTVIRLWYNEKFFPHDEHIDIEDLISRLKYTSYIVPKFEINIIDHTNKNEDGTDVSYRFYSEHGLEEMVEARADGAVLPGTETKGNVFSEKGIYLIKTQGNYKESVLTSEGETEDITRTVTADVAFRYGTGYDRNVASFVNTIHTHLGGVHEKALEDAIMKTFGERMRSMRGILTAKDEPPIIDDFLEGMTIVLSINVPEPQFVGQQKDKLSGPEVKKALTKALTSCFNDFINDSSHQKIIKPMLEKVAQASRNRHAAAEAKLAKRKSSQVASSTMPITLSDCDLTGTEESELLICEGESAKGTIVEARDATYQAVLPIRGKILNSLKASTKQLVDNREVTDIAKALGAGFGTSFDIEKIRYGKVIFAADADVDGLQICNLLYTVFYRLFLPMILEGRVYQAVPPLFEVKVGSGARQEVIYVANESDLPPVLAKLEKEKKKYKIDRNKGLGEMNAKAFHDTVLDPENRTLRRLNIGDVAAAEAALYLTMGDNSQERKDFIGENFQVAIDSGLVEGYESGF